jgi:hypothetical protein
MRSVCAGDAIETENATVCTASSLARFAFPGARGMRRR